MQNWLVRPWRQSFNFKGRATRREYWLFFVTLGIGYFGLIFLMTLLIGLLESVPVNVALAFAVTGYMLFALIAMLSLSVRRLHDQDKSGWFILLTFVPLIGILFWILIGFWPGTEGENDYGWNPRDGDRAGPGSRTDFRLTAGQA